MCIVKQKERLTIIVIADVLFVFYMILILFYYLTNSEFIPITNQLLSIFNISKANFVPKYLCPSSTGWVLSEPIKIEALPVV
jgi:hypothetical protein